MPDIKNLELQNVPNMLQLNNAHAAETSLLDTSGMGGLLNMAFYRRGIDQGLTAILIALD
ncbi:hypothetical protein [Acidicapsa ligni]|uniref:hypothetical protein n=1 Tax=Acidicapsa ligni TaxID=542300 RepID=UPI0021E0CBFB|nr:hypothetical protein [Acidicapsa ligni]